MDQAQTLGVALGLGAFAVLLLILFIKANIVICQPNEILVLSGRKRKQPDGSVLGYRVLRGGRGFRMPFMESVARLPLTTLPIEIHLDKAQCAGMIPVMIESRANVKLAGKPEEGLDAAVERFLGKGTDPVIRTAQQAIEGALRGVVATVSPEEANAKRLELAKQVVESARTDLSQLGIVLDLFQIEDISDSHGYLEAIGRKANATVRRDAEIAEAEAKAQSRQVTAEQQRAGRQAEIDAEKAIVEEENALAVKTADLAADTNRAREKASVAGEIARVGEQVELETKRVDLNSQRERAATVVPAIARRDAMRLEAEGRAARTKEEGRAKAEALELLREQWSEGDNQDLFLIQLLPELLDKVTRVVADNLTVEKLTILDGGNGEGLPTYVSNLTKSAITMLEQVKNATGIDLEKLAERSNRDAAELPKDLG